jgi:hypothetical protein
MPTSLSALRDNSVLIAASTVAINVMPYWLVPGSGARYLMPLYPLCALVLAYVVLNSGKFILGLTAKALIVSVGVVYLLVLVGHPLYQQYFRGNYAAAAQAIITRAGDFPVFVKDDTSLGLSIAANLNAQRGSRPLVTTPPADFQSGFVLTRNPDPSIGQLDMTLTLRRGVIGLLLRPEDWTSSPPPPLPR